jgi:excisionase family DNA binding protein
MNSISVRQDRAVGIRLLDLHSASRYVSLSYWTVREMALRGDIPLVRAGRRILIDRQDLDLWIERNKERG